MQPLNKNQLSQIQGGIIGIPTAASALMAVPIVAGFIAIGTAVGLAGYGIYCGIKGAIDKHHPNDTLVSSK
jgi:bacteriocin-like protein